MARPRSGEKKIFRQKSAYHSPWSPREKVAMALWLMAETVLFRGTPKPLNQWRLFLLRLFGAKVTGKPFVSQSCRIRIPWHLTLDDRACLGEKVVVYNLGPIHLKARSTVAQESYLCAGTHDLSKPTLPLVTQPIVIEEDAFVGARAMILPGVTVARGSVVGAASVVRKSTEPWVVYAGNPAVKIKERAWEGPR